MSPLRQLALTAQGVSLAPDSVGLSHGAESRVRLPVKKPNALRTHDSIVTLTRRTLSPAARACSALVHDMMASGRVV
ncbi:hypothetical protein R6254_05075 [Polaromonas sp. SM01]|nr:hypothetical protein [Polaromonas sp. SM01]MDW5441895.1 hypothetical protein [Polaromonas sp. SM01]